MPTGQVLLKLNFLNIVWPLKHSVVGYSMTDIFPRIKCTEASLAWEEIYYSSDYPERQKFSYIFQCRELTNGLYLSLCDDVMIKIVYSKHDCQSLFF